MSQPERSAMHAPPTLLFVYNAKPGLLHAIGDSFHKWLAPASYPCALCALTYGFFTMRPAWRRYLDSLPVEPSFVYRDDFRRGWPPYAAWPLPLVALARNDGLDQVIGASDFLRLDDVAALIRLMDERLAPFGLRS